jgi:hypothetical protein
MAFSSCFSGLFAPALAIVLWNSTRWRGRLLLLCHPAALLLTSLLQGQNP